LKALLLLLGLLAGSPGLLHAEPKAALAALQPQASPALWHIKGEQGEVYLLGSIHILPPDLAWRSPAIQRGLARSDVFVFEVSQDEAALAQLQSLIQANGILPLSESLRGLLHSKSLPDYDAAVASAGVRPDIINRMRPWLAGLQLVFAELAKQKYAPTSGVDSVLMTDARKNQKPMRYLETISEQFALLAPDDRALEVQEFEANLRDIRNIAAELDPLVKAWSAGDQAKLDRLINGDLDEFPEARKMLLDDRNRRWAPKIQAMLKEKHVFFVTVGAGHLTGPVGLPALLRKAGYKVEGP